MRSFCVILFLFIITQVYCQNKSEGKDLYKTFTIDSQILNENRKIQIYLPPSYQETSKKFPVLYVVDGQRYFLNGVAFQQNLTWQEVAPEFIVVGIITDSRKRRSLFYRKAPKFIQFLEKELIPEIDSKYRTLNMRIYFGWEMAAALGMQIFAEKPLLFDGFLMASPTHITKERLELVSTALKNQPKQHLKFYTTLGTVENWATQPMHSLDSIFKKHPVKNIAWKYNLSDNENHYTTTLTTINEGLKLFFNDYKPLRFYSIKEFTDFGGIKKLKEHYSKRGKTYQTSAEIHRDTKHYLLLQAHIENNFKLFEALVNQIDGKNFMKAYYRQGRWFNRFANFYLENNKHEDALEILELGLNKFPDASILHFGKGNYYKAINKMKDAKNWYKKAIAIAKKNNEPALENYINALKNL